jgi:hypothetical protein
LLCSTGERRRGATARGHLADDAKKSPAPHSQPRRALIVTYLIAGALGGVLGAQGLLPFGTVFPTSSTPLARVGYALQTSEANASAEDWTALGRDIELVRTAWKAEEPATFELVVALRGLGDRGNSEWTRAQGLCRSLKWPHCDQRALEEMKRRCKP